MVFALVFVRGSVNAVDNPTRQSFVIEMVGADRVVNAVGLNSVLVHSARILGPAGAGILIATARRRPLFPAQRAHLRRDDRRAARRWTRELLTGRRRRPTPTTAGSGPRSATSAATPALLIPLAMMVVVGTLGFNFQVLLPLLGRFTLRRRRRHLHGARGRDGGRLGRRRARHRRPRAASANGSDRRLGRSVRGRRAGRRGRADAAARAARAGPARRRQRHLRRRRQLHPAARRRPRRCAAG